MKKLSLLSFEYLLLSVLLIFSQASISQALTQKTIQKAQNLQNCKVKVDRHALYMCQDKTYLFASHSHLKQFDQKILEEHAAVDADIDDGNFIMVNKTHLVYIPYNSDIREVQLDDEVPVFVRIKVKDDKPNSRKMMLLGVHEPDTVISDPKDNTKKTIKEGRLKIYSWIISGLLHEYRLHFPSDPLIQLSKDKPFKQITMMSDPRFGHDYALFGLQNGVIATFRYEFDSAELKYLFASKMVGNDQLVDMADGGVRLFVLSESEHKTLSLWVYKLGVYPEVEFHRECHIDLAKYGSPKGTPEIKVKFMFDHYIAMINYPGEKILSFSTKHPDLSVFPFNCLAEPQVIEYGKLEGGSTVGYSFDFFAHYYIDEYFDHGFLLSPLSSNTHTSTVIPYCLPLTFLDEKKGCVFCETGASPGGQATSCSSCDTQVKSNQKLVEGFINPLNQCPVACKESGKFGPKCDTCDAYMSSVGITPPGDATWGTTNQGVCTLNCPAEQYLLDDKCVDKKTFNIFQDHCSQMSDCMSCSLSDSCSWCSGSCKSTDACQAKDKVFLREYLSSAMECPAEERADYCGSPNFTESKGNITFSSNTVRKNNLCGWKLTPAIPTSSSMRVNLNIRTGNLTEDEKLNLPSIYINFCQVVAFTTECYLKQIPYNEEGMPHYTLDVTELHFFVWVQEDMIDKAHNFQIEYSY